MEQRPDGTFDFGLVNARSWWIAVELCRRHPSLVIGEWGSRNGNEAGGPRDALGLYDDGAGEVLIELNRAGRLRVPVSGRVRGDGYDDDGGGAGEGVGDGERPFSLAWSDVFAEPPHRTVAVLEHAAGLEAPSRRLRTTGHLLSYRILAAVVGLGALGRRPWDVRSAYPMGHDAAPAAHLFEEFRGADERRASAPGKPLGDAGHGFWALRRNGGADYLLDHWGWLYTRDRPPRDLHGPYREHGRNLWRLVADVFGDELD